MKKKPKTLYISLDTYIKGRKGNLSKELILEGLNPVQLIYPIPDGSAFQKTVFSDNEQWEVYIKVVRVSKNT